MSKKNEAALRTIDLIDGSGYSIVDDNVLNIFYNSKYEMAYIVGWRKPPYILGEDEIIIMIPKSAILQMNLKPISNETR